MLLSFPAAPGSTSSTSAPRHTAHGIALTNFRVATDPDGFNTARPAIRIQGTKGEVQVDGPAFRPTVWRFIQASGDRDPQGGRRNEEGVKETVCEIPGHGMFWEADECARCLRDVSGIPLFSPPPSIFAFLGFARMYIFVSEEKRREEKEKRKEKIANVDIFFFFSSLTGQIGKRNHGLGGEYRYHGDDGSGPEAGWHHVPGENRDDGVSRLLVKLVSE